MITLHKKFKLSIFQQLFIFVFLIIALFCGISIYFNYLSEENARKHVIESSYVKANSFLSSFENDVERLINIQDQFVNDDGLLMLSTSATILNKYDEQKSINDLQKRLYYLTCASKYVEDVSCQIPGIQKIVTVNSSINDLSNAEFEQMRYFRSSNGDIFLPVEDKLFINMPYPLSSNKNSKPLFNLSISISKDQIENTMQQFFPHSDEGCILTGFNDDWRVSTNDAIADAIINQLDVSEIDTLLTQNRTRKILLDSKNYWLIGHYSTELGIGVIVYLTDDVVVGQIFRYQYWYLGLAVTSLLLLVSYAFWANRRFGNPMKRLVYAFKRVETGEIAYTISHKTNDEFAYIYSQFNTMMVKIDNLISQVYEQRIMMQQAEMKQLQYQINPHFLYNSLYLIHNLASIQDHESVIKLSEHLGGYYKYITRKSTDTVPLHEEISHMMDYIAVQIIRFGDRISIVVDDIPNDCTNILVPPLILQPIVENAYGHGLKKTKANGLLQISFSRDENELKICIEDNGGIEVDAVALLQQQIQSTGNMQSITGLQNVHRRLLILFGNDCGITLSLSKLGGLCVAIKISTRCGDSDV